METPFKTLPQWKEHPEEAKELHDKIQSGEIKDVCKYTMYKIEVALGLTEEVKTEAGKFRSRLLLSLK